MALTLKEAKLIAYANYARGGDYIVVMLNDRDIENRFCKEGGKKALYDYMASVVEMRRYIRTCVV